MRKRFLLTGLIVAALAAVGWYVWDTHYRQDPNLLTLYGNVDIRQVSAAFEISGRIASMAVEEGDQVKAGDELAKLTTRTIDLQIAEARAQVDSAQAQLDRMINGSRPQEVRQARDRVEQSEAQLKLAQQRLKRLEDANDGEYGLAVSKLDIEEAQTQVTVADATLKEARETYSLAKEGPRREDVNRSRAQLAQAKAQLAQLKHRIEQSTLKSPADAVVRSRVQEPGDMTSASHPVYTLAKTSPKWVRTYVSEPYLSRLRPGMAAKVYTDSEPEKPVVGTIGYISSVAEFTPKEVQTEDLRTALVYEVRVIVKDPKNQLRLGMPATVRIELGGSEE